MVETAKVPSRPLRKRAAKKPTASALAICPADGSGWCPYPFSIAQLERHLKRKAEISTEVPAAKGRQLVKARSK